MGQVCASGISFRRKVGVHKQPTRPPPVYRVVRVPMSKARKGTVLQGRRILPISSMLSCHSDNDNDNEDEEEGGERVVKVGESESESEREREREYGSNKNKSLSLRAQPSSKRNVLHTS